MYNTSTYSSKYNASSKRDWLNIYIYIYIYISATYRESSICFSSALGIPCDPYFVINCYYYYYYIVYDFLSTNFNRSNRVNVWYVLIYNLACTYMYNKYRKFCTWWPKRIYSEVRRHGYTGAPCTHVLIAVVHYIPIRSEKLRVNYEREREREIESIPLDINVSYSGASEVWAWILMYL